MLSPILRRSNTVVLSPQLRSVSRSFSISSPKSSSVAVPLSSSVSKFSLSNNKSSPTAFGHSRYNVNKFNNQPYGLREFSTSTPPPNPESNINKEEAKTNQEQQQQQKKRKSGLGRALLIVTGSAVLASYIFFKVNDRDVKVEYLKRIPFRVTSHLWGKMANIEVPQGMRKLVYGTYASLFGVKIDEAEKPMEEYPSLAAFFCRRLKKRARKIDSSAPLISPVDGTVIYSGAVNGDSIEQVKGINYSLKDFLGENEIAQLKDKNLFHVGIYLSPGDYHGIHSPCEWTINERNHFPGYLFPVAKVAVDNIPGLFALNERVVLAGNWKHGFFSLTPVGASNVGTIEMDFDKELKTNNQNDKYGRPEDYYFKSYSSPIKQKKGEELAFFKMGSTVILIFELPKDQQFNFNLKPGQTVTLGQSIGSISKKK